MNRGAARCVLRDDVHVLQTTWCGRVLADDPVIVDVGSNPVCEECDRRLAAARRRRLPTAYLPRLLGLCDGTPAWWGHWSDLVTRAPRLDDEDYEWFTEPRKLDYRALVEALPRWPRDVFPGAPNQSQRDPWLAYAWSEGPLRRWEYRGEGDGPVPTDDCAYPGPRGYYECNGSCERKR